MQILIPLYSQAYSQWTAVSYFYTHALARSAILRKQLNTRGSISIYYLLLVTSVAKVLECIPYSGQTQQKMNKI